MNNDEYAIGASQRTEQQKEGELQCVARIRRAAPEQEWALQLLRFTRSAPQKSELIPVREHELAELPAPEKSKNDDQADAHDVKPAWHTGAGRLPSTNASCPFTSHMLRHR